MLFCKWLCVEKVFGLVLVGFVFLLSYKIFCVFCMFVFYNFCYFKIWENVLVKKSEIFYICWVILVDVGNKVLIFRSLF